MRPIGVWITSPELSGIECVIWKKSTVKFLLTLTRSSVETCLRSTSDSLMRNSSNLPRSRPRVSFAPYIGTFGSSLTM